MEVAVGVTVTLKMTGMAVVSGMSLFPEWMVVVIVVKLVVRESETVGVGVGVTELLVELSLCCWAKAGARRARRMRRAGHRKAGHERGPDMRGDLEGEGRMGVGGKEGAEGRRGRGYILEEKAMEEGVIVIVPASDSRLPTRSVVGAGTSDFQTHFAL